MPMHKLPGVPTSASPPVMVHREPQIRRYPASRTPQGGASRSSRNVAKRDAIGRTPVESCARRNDKVPGGEVVWVWPPTGCVSSQRAREFCVDDEVARKQRYRGKGKKKDERIRI